MMFNLKDFIKKGLLDAVGKMADYQVILNAAGWHDKGVLSEGDLADIQAAVDAKNATAADENAPTEV
ncbi:MAG: hypothetical protein IIX15_05275 [Clostridia bacterium]|nr:hypothetical protein [Clostridia bacterium]